MSTFRVQRGILSGPTNVPSYGDQDYDAWVAAGGEPDPGHHPEYDEWVAAGSRDIALVNVIFTRTLALVPAVDLDRTFLLASPRVAQLTNSQNVTARINGHGVVYVQVVSSDGP